MFLLPKNMRFFAKWTHSLKTNPAVKQIDSRTHTLILLLLTRLQTVHSGWFVFNLGEVKIQLLVDVDIFHNDLSAFENVFYYPKSPKEGFRVRLGQIDGRL
jgi:hypothetical protein